MNKDAQIDAAQLWTVLARCFRSLSLVVENCITESGLGLSDFMVLEALLHKGPLTITEIQAKVLLATGSMTAAVDRLERKGLLVRRFTSEDRRARRLELTAEGKKLIQTVFRQHERDVERVVSVLNDKERQQLYNSAKKLGLFAAESLRERSAKSASGKTGEKQ